MHLKMSAMVGAGVLGLPFAIPEFIWLVTDHYTILI